MTSPDFPRLVADIGGTNARFGLQRAQGAPVLDVQVLACEKFAGVADAIGAYLHQVGDLQPGSCAIGIATPITGDRIAMTNHHWAFSIAELKQQLKIERLIVINDFTALALAIPALSAGDLKQLGGHTAKPHAPRALIGPGTGLGVGGLLVGPRGIDVPVSGEGGHATLAAADDDEAAVIGELRRRFGHVSAERAVSGPGLVALYEACCVIDRVAAHALQAADVTARAIDGSDAQCGRAVAHFLSFLGNAAGNLALTLGALGGVYIGGGVLQRLWPLVPGSKLRQRFEEKGRFNAYLAPIPIYVIDAKVQPGLLGAARALDNAY